MSFRDHIPQIQIRLRFPPATAVAQVTNVTSRGAVLEAKECRPLRNKAVGRRHYALSYRFPNCNCYKLVYQIQFELTGFQQLHYPLLVAETVCIQI